MEAKIPCGRNRVLRLMNQAGIEAQRGYGKPKNMYAGKPYAMIPNMLNREFKVAHPNQGGLVILPKLRPMKASCL